MSDWERVHHLTAELVGLAEDDGAVRLANLALAAALARRAGREVPCRTQSAIRYLARSSISLPAGEDSLWRAVGDAATAAADDGLPWADLTAQLQARRDGRKARGAYATHEDLASAMADAALDALATIRTPRVIDPAAGGGALLLAFMRRFRSERSAAPDEARAVLTGLAGVEIDAAARELACLGLWIEHADLEVSLTTLSRNIRLGNALAILPGRQSYDAVIMNPPWESLRHGEAVTAVARSQTLGMLDSRRRGAVGLPDLFTQQGVGDVNLFKLFLELAPHLVRADGGVICGLVPSAFASDLGLQPLRRLYLDRTSVIQWTGFENRARYFPIDARYKFGLLVARRGGPTAETRIRVLARHAEEVTAQHLRVSRQELRVLGGPHEALPEVASRREADILVRTVNSGTPLLSSGSAFGPVSYVREVDLSLARDSFFHRDDNPIVSIDNDGMHLVELDGRPVSLFPLVEGRMVGAYDCFAKSWLAGSGRQAKWAMNDVAQVRECRPQYLALPRDYNASRVAICDITASTNTRTVMAAWVPPRWQCGNTAPTLRFATTEQAFAAVAVLNSMVFDWVARRVVAGLHLNKFYLAGLRWPRVDREALSLLTAAGRQFSASVGRPGMIVSDSRRAVGPSGADLIETHASVEALVAVGLGLETSHLEQIFDSSVSDRRGLWRHFDTDPHARVIAERTLERVGMAGVRALPVAQSASW